MFFHATLLSYCISHYNLVLVSEPYYTTWNVLKRTVFSQMHHHWFPLLICVPLTLASHFIKASPCCIHHLPPPLPFDLSSCWPQDMYCLALAAPPISLKIVTITLKSPILCLLSSRLSASFPFSHGILCFKLTWTYLCTVPSGILLQGLPVCLNMEYLQLTSSLSIQNQKLSWTSCVTDTLQRPLLYSYDYGRKA